MALQRASSPIWLLRSQIPSSAIFTLLTSLATVRATPEAAALMTAAQPNARAEIFPPSAKLTRSWSASGPSRRSQDFWSDYSSGPIGALPRHTIARTRPSITHQHVARSHQPSETCPLTTFLAPFRADRVTYMYATTTRGLAFASAEPLHAQLEQIFVSAPARLERGACARPRAWQNQRSATHVVVQRSYACVVPCVAWEERGLSPLV